MEKKSKIEKLVFAGDLIENELERIRIKINKIIDHLNSQDQAGEYPQKAKYISGEVPEEKKTLVQLRRVFDKKRVKEWDRIAMETYKQATQDTPEEKEGWEERFVKRFGYFSSEIDFIKNLLLEREREVLESMRDWVIEYYKDTWNIRDFDAEIAIGKIVDRELDKLNK